MPSRRQPRFVVYQGEDAPAWRWRLVAGNGRTLAAGEGFITKAHAERAVETVRTAAYEARVRIQPA